MHVLQGSDNFRLPYPKIAVVRIFRFIAYQIETEYPNHRNRLTAFHNPSKLTDKPLRVDVTSSVGGVAAT